MKSNHFSSNPGLYIIVKLLDLALTSIVLDLANLVTNSTKPSLGQPRHQPDQT